MRAWLFAGLAGWLGIVASLCFHTPLVATKAAMASDSEVGESKQVKASQRTLDVSQLRSTYWTFDIAAMLRNVWTSNCFTHASQQRKHRCATYFHFDHLRNLAN